MDWQEVFLFAFIFGYAAAFGLGVLVGLSFSFQKLIEIKLWGK